MARAAITQAEITRAIAAATKAGTQIGRVEIDLRRGIVTILPPGAPARDDEDLDDELEAWSRKRAEGRPQQRPSRHR